MINEEELKEAKIFSLVFVPSPSRWVVILEEIGGNRLVPIWIGPSEGSAIAAWLNKEKIPRPLTHDLVVNILKRLGVSFERVVVNDLKENTYFSLIELRFLNKSYLIDSRPSDALALAVRTGAKVYLSEKILLTCPVIRKPITDNEIAQFKEELKKTRPEDFFRNIPG